MHKKKQVTKLDNNLNKNNKANNTGKLWKINYSCPSAYWEHLESEVK